MNRELFKKTEDKLYNYFKQENKISTLRHRIDILEKQIFEIAQDLKKCNVSIEVESSNLRFEERVQSSSDRTSYAEREVIRITDLKLKRKLDKELEVERIKEEIENIELDNAILDYNLKYLNREMYNLLMLKYKQKLNETQISFAMNISQSQVNKIKQKVIADIINWEGWRKVE